MSSIPFRIHVLGCGCATPSLRHNLSSQVIEMRDKFFMIDCGEGTQLQLRHHRIRFNNLNAIFITHLHGDHCFGLLGMISTFGLLGRTAPIHVYAPRDLEDIMNRQIACFCPALSFKVVFHAVDTEHSCVVYDDRSLTVTSIPLSHRVPCAGYLFCEKPTLPHIDRAACDFYRVPTSQYQNIKEGASFLTSDGQTIPSSQLTRPADPPRSYAYCSDTAYKPDICPLIHGVSLLYHEATFGEDKLSSANLYKHSTAKQAAQIAKQAEAKRLMLGHFSPRYDDETVLLREAQEIFPNTLLANERETVEINEC